MLGLEKTEKIHSTHFFRKVVGFVGRFFTAYHASLYWVDKSPHVHCHVRYLFLCPKMDLKTLTDKISSGIRDLGLKVSDKVLNQKTAFIKAVIHASSSWNSTTLTFLAKGDKLGILGITKTKSRSREYAIFTLMIVLAFIATFGTGILTNSEALFLLALIASMVIGTLISIFVPYHMSVKQSKPVVFTILKVLEKTCQCRFRYGGKFPFKFPRIAHWSIDEFLKTVFSKAYATA